MATEFALSIVGPEGEIVATPVISFIAPGHDGYFGVMAGHEPMVAALRPGLLEYSDPTENRFHIYVSGGFVEISRTGATVLADEARRAQEIDASEAERELNEARMALRGESSAMTSSEAVEEIERATARLKAARAVH